MIAKVTRGRGFKGLLSYLLAGADGRQAERVEWTARRHLGDFATDLIPTLMHGTAAQSADIERPVYHLTISLHPSEKLDREQLEQVVDRTLADLGLAEHQAYLVAHNDTEHQHVHVMVNRVHPETGIAWNGGHDYARIEKSLRHQERELGLREIKGRHFTLDGQPRHQRAELSSGDRRFRERTGSGSFGEHVRAVARRDMLEAGSWGQLHERLGEVGLRLQKRGRGLVVTDGERKVKASFVDRKAALAGLERRLGPYEPSGREFPAGKSERWGQVQELRATVEELARRREEERSRDAERWGEQAAERQAQRLRHRLGAASRGFDERLGEVYRDPAGARRAFNAGVKNRGEKKALNSLAREPEKLGKVLGRGGPFSSAQRWSAIEAAPQAATTARDFLGALTAHNLHRGVAGQKAKASRQASRGRRRPRRTSPTGRQLKRTAGKLIKHLGWRLAARALTAPQYQLLRMTLRVGRLAVDAALELQRGG
ncbi:MAG: relaxase/mobilization nuclease domain-containing protein [bacterium]|nr:relaxase/mobilization nuclease domain-containing protein [bacterium]